MDSKHPFWELPPELRLAIYDYLDMSMLATFARSYASSNPEVTACRANIELELYRRDLAGGEHVALLYAIESSRKNPVAACGTVAKLRKYGQYSIGASSAFQRKLESLISTDRGRHINQEVPLITVARTGHPSLFKLLFEAQFLTSATSTEDMKLKAIALDGTKRALHNPNKRAPEGMTEQIEDMTALGYAFRRSHSDKPGDSPEMLRAVLSCARLLLRQLAEEGASLQTRAMDGSITPAEASKLSIDFGVRSQTAYRMGHVVSIDYAPLVSWSQPDSVSVLTHLAWVGDPYNLLPGLLSDYRAMVDCSSINWRGNIAPLHGAITSVCKREFDTIMVSDDINLNVLNTTRTSTPITMTLSILPPPGASGRRPKWQVYATRLEMLQSLLKGGADPNFPTKNKTPLSEIVRLKDLGVMENDNDAIRFAHEASEIFLTAGADPLKTTPWGSCAMMTLLHEMHSQTGKTTAKAKKMFKVLGETLRQFTHHRPELLSASIPLGYGSALGLAVSWKSTQLTKLLRSLGAS